MSNAIEVADVHKAYRRYGRRKHFATLKSALLSGSVLRELRPDEVFHALRGVSFNVAKGTTCGIVGRNGSGKSTMLKMVAGIGKPTAGSVRVDGRVSALIELGAGFHPEISGRENVFINGMMLGLTKREIAQRFDEIVAFAELQAFIDEPVKSYSSGMYMRLGFAVAVNVDPDVLLVDEVLAVGDEAFTHRCLDKFAEFKRRGKTILFVTHQLDLVQRFCDEALWLDQGLARAQGDPKRVIDAYLMDVAQSENQSLATAEAVAQRAADGQRQGAGGAASSAVANEAGADRWGSRDVEIVGVELSSTPGTTHVFDSGAPMEIRLRVRVNRRVDDVAFGIGIFNAEGVCCFGTNTAIDGQRVPDLAAESEVRVTIEHLDLVEGSYKLDVAAHARDGAPYDYHRLMHSFRVTSEFKHVGIYRPHHRWAFSATPR